MSEYNTAESIVTINDLVQGLTNFNPQEGHIICEGLIQGPHLCIHTSKGRKWDWLNQNAVIYEQ